MALLKLAWSCSMRDRSIMCKILTIIWTTCGTTGATRAWTRCSRKASIWRQFTPSLNEYILITRSLTQHFSVGFFIFFFVLNIYFIQNYSIKMLACVFFLYANTKKETANFTTTIIYLKVVFSLYFVNGCLKWVLWNGMNKLELFISKMRQIPAKHFKRQLSPRDHSLNSNE